MKAARKLMEDEELWELACFHFQQAAEKCLKGFLATNGQRAPRTHDLEELVRLRSGIDIDFLSIRDDALGLNPYYLETRYSASLLQLSAERIAAAEEAADRVSSFVATRIVQ